MSRGFGLAAAVGNDVVREMAGAAEAAGYSSFWVNDTPGNDGLERLAAAAGNTSIWLGVGVVSLDRRSAQSIVEDVKRYGLPEERLYLGIGSGAPRGALAKVRDGVQLLQDHLAATIVVAALGPRMLELAGEVADGVLMNWITPAWAAESVTRIESSSDAANRVRPRLIAYARCGLLPEAGRMIRAEADRYASIPAYANHFERQGVSAESTIISGVNAEAIQTRLTDLESLLDETVIRAITPDDDPATILRLLEAARPPEAVSEAPSSGR
jgi:alkanesulfonate monooxygenase SsuD/methylene tetrahydromethanopterin reductase-like flavin-dependent oxidoreductase (luciferase family)